MIWLWGHVWSPSSACSKGLDQRARSVQRVLERLQTCDLRLATGSSACSTCDWLQTLGYYCQTSFCKSPLDFCPPSSMGIVRTVQSCYTQNSSLCICCARLKNSVRTPSSCTVVV